LPLGCSSDMATSAPWVAHDCKPRWQRWKRIRKDAESSWGGVRGGCVSKLCWACRSETMASGSHQDRRLGPAFGYPVKEAFERKMEVSPAWELGLARRTTRCPSVIRRVGGWEHAVEASQAFPASTSLALRCGFRAEAH